MAGIYIHIPFCKQACYYCDFHFSTSLSKKTQVVDAICEEISLQKDYLKGQPVHTLYFGGGTPSLLDKRELDRIIESVHTNFSITPEAEITLEANPDDLSLEKLTELKDLGINRLSIGIQTFSNSQLHYLHRAHNAEEAESCVKRAQDMGISNITIDLIYGIPSPDHSLWQRDLDKAVSLGTKHISAYCLTIEPQTVFGKWLKKGSLKAVDEEYSAQQFEMLILHLQANGFEQYEISNFALPGFYSRHNSNYWKNEPYLGIGPSAHSYNLESRQYNVSNNSKYVQQLDQKLIPCTVEPLSLEDRVNEYIMTSLRTSWGCDLNKIKTEFNVDLYTLHEPLLRSMFEKKLITSDNNVLILTNSGKLLADKIAVDLFID